MHHRPSKSIQEKGGLQAHISELQAKGRVRKGYEDFERMRHDYELPAGIMAYRFGVSKPTMTKWFAVDTEEHDGQA